MFGSRKKRLRDRQAGLVQDWRRKDAAYWPLFLAFICTSMVFAFCAYALRIPLSEDEAGELDRRAAVELFELSADAPRDLRLLVETGSYDRPKSLTLAILDERVDELTQPTIESPIQYRDLPVTVPEATIPPLDLSGLLTLPRRPPEPISRVFPQDLASLALQADGPADLVSRLPQKPLTVSLGDKVSLQMLGRQVRALVTVSADGTIRSAWVLEPEPLSDPLAEAVQAWLPLQRLSPAEGATETVGELIFTLSAP